MTVDAVIVSGVFPGMTSPVYPEGTVALVKEPRARGSHVTYADPDVGRHEISLYSVDWVLPIVIFTAQGVGNGAIRIFVEGVWSRIKRAIARDAEQSRTAGDTGIAENRTPTLHAQWCIERDGERRWFKADGPAHDVLAAMEATRE